MNRYLMIESRDPFESADATRWCELAQAADNTLVIATR